MLAGARSQRHNLVTAVLDHKTSPSSSSDGILAQFMFSTLLPVHAGCDHLRQKAHLYMITAREHHGRQK